MSDQFNTQTPRAIKLQLWWFSASLITINVSLFFWAVLHGMNITDPSSFDAIRWGADYAPLTFLEEPIRLFTSMFFHFGLIHLMLNMWALYIFGHLAEQLYGRVYFIALYLLAGLMGSLLSGYMSIQDSYTLITLGEPKQSLYPGVSAGASGAVMGIGAALTVLSLLPEWPKQRFILDKKTLLWVMGINLAMGFSISGINNAAHIGGMLMGGLLSLFWYWGQRSQNSKCWQTVGIVVATLLCVLFYTYCQHLVAHIQPLWQSLAEWIQHPPTT